MNKDLSKEIESPEGIKLDMTDEEEKQHNINILKKLNFIKKKK